MATDEYRPYLTSRMRDWPVQPYAVQKAASPHYPPRGVCPWCGRNYRLLKDNTMAGHDYDRTRCPGAGETTANLVEPQPDQ